MPGKWREGNLKTSYNYLLLDPRITLNLPNRFKQLSENETWKTFLSAIFYVGKGKIMRHFDHLHEAKKLYLTKKDSDDSKCKHILDIWNENLGVVVVQMFHDSIAVEAYTREAAMISAINLKNLKNAKNGQFYGLAVTWTDHEKNLYGTYLLQKSMTKYLTEGEKQLRPQDISV